MFKSPTNSENAIRLTYQHTDGASVVQPSMAKLPVTPSIPTGKPPFNRGSQSIQINATISDLVKWPEGQLELGMDPNTTS